MEINEDGEPVIGQLFDYLVGDTERTVVVSDEGAAKKVDDDCAGGDDESATRCAGWIVSRPDNGEVRIEYRQDIFLRPDMIACGNDIYSGIQQFLGGGWGQACPAGDILAVRDDEITRQLLSQFRQERRDRLSAGFADHVPDDKRPQMRYRSAYLAISTARVSRTTVTFIWPG